MDTIKEALTFDDVLLLPKYSNVLPSNTNIFLKLSKKISLKVPFLTSAMDTVTESKMASAIAKEGGLGIIHRNLNIQKQSQEVKKLAKTVFKKVNFFKPESSRKESKETYLHCEILKTL